MPIHAFSSFVGQDNDYTANAVNFDGSNDYLRRNADLTGLSDGKQGTVSVWFNNQEGSSGAFRYVLSGIRFSIARLNTNRFRVLGRTVGNVNTLLMDSSMLYTGVGWHHLMASWNLATLSTHFYIDGGNAKGGTVTQNNNNIDYTFSQFDIGAQGAGNFKWIGYLADLFFHNTYIDLGQAANRRKFRSASGKPVNLGPDGSTPLGVQPLVFLSGDTASWHTNKGTGGGFTEYGALTTAPSSPSD